jgi:signal transduction histidine kinase
MPVNPASTGTASVSRAPQKPWRMRTRLGIALLLVFAPMSLLVILSHIEDIRDRRHSKVESFRTIDDAIAASIDGFARDLESFTLSTAISLGELSATQDLNQETVGPYFKDLFNSYGVLRSIFLTDLSGKTVAGTAGNTGFDLSGRDYIKAMQSGAESYWSDALAGALSGQTTLAYARPVKSPDGVTRYFLVVAFYPSQLLSRLPSDLPPDANVSLIGRNGVVLFTSQDQGPDRQLRDISDSSFFRRATVERRVLLRSEPTPLEDGDRYGAFVQMPSTGWLAGVTVTAESVDRPLATRFRRNLLIVAMVLAGGFGVMLLIAGRVSRPLSQLAAAARAIASGQRPVVPHQSADADVRELEFAMESMSGSIAAREESLRVAANAGEILAQSLDYEDTLSRLADLLVPAAADCCVIHILEGGALHQVATRHRDPAMLPFLDELQALYPDPSGPEYGPAAVAKGGASQMTAAITDEMRVAVARDERHLELLRILGFTSYLCIPISNHEAVLGTITLLSATPSRLFTNLDLQLAEDIGRRAGAAITNARLYRESQQAREELERSNRQKDEFLGIIGHELRTPLTSIYGGARLLNNPNRKLSEPSRAALLETLEVEASKMTRLIENLLLLARTELGAEPEWQRFSPMDMVESAGADVRRQSPDRRIAIEKARGDQPVYSDPTRIEQVVQNLLSNADKYSPAGAPIEVWIGGGPNELTVRVTDSGPGVSPDELQLLFESFYRSAATSNLAPGKGLGLAVCRRLVESLGGRIWATNRPSGGLEAGFSVPLRAGPQAPGRDDATPAPRGLSRATA